MMRRVLLSLLFLLLARPLAAQDVDAANDAIAAVDAGARGGGAGGGAGEAGGGGGQRAALLDRATTLSQGMTENSATLTAQMALVDARGAHAGPAPPAGQTEAADIAAQRRALSASRTKLDSATKRGKLIGVEADQLAGEIRDSAADAFNERIAAHTASPLTPAFWHLFRELLPRDLVRARAFWGAERRAVSAAFARGDGWPALAGLLVALALLLPVRRGLVRFGRNFMIERAPSSRLRRSGLALWIALSGTLLPGLGAVILVAGLGASGMIAAPWARVFDTVIRVAFVAGAIVALGNALLQPRLPSWRLPPLGDEAAMRLRPWTRAAAAVVIVTALLSTLASEAGSNGPLTMAVSGLCVAIDVALAIGILRTIAGLRADAEREAEERDGEDGAAAARIAGSGPAALAAWLVVALVVVASLAGYIPFALMLSRLLVWWPLLGAALYLLLVAVDDLSTGLVSRESRMGASLVHGFGVRASLIDQAGVFLSALLRLILVALAFSVATGPFGTNVTSLVDVTTRMAQGLTIGQITISPAAILRGIAVLAAGLFVVRLVQHWLTDRYLPATELDAGARNSVAVVARYAGIILAALWALASLGIGIERIALLLSALSVGIGFGLQAITQNFVSGLILLAERPVKIGDWVRIGTDEGDVKRISVRATEIQIGDKSTLIVPNSELITKAVLNKTLSDPLGRVQLQFSLPLGADVGQARDLLMTIYEGVPAVLDDPQPVVFIDSIVDGRVAFNSFAYVRSPREVYPTRSAILFRLLADLPAAGIELGSTPQQMQIVGGGAMPPMDEPPPPRTA